MHCISELLILKFCADMSNLCTYSLKHLKILIMNAVIGGNLLTNHTYNIFLTLLKVYSVFLCNYDLKI